MVLGLAGIAAVGTESVFFGHGHLTGGHGIHHNHLYLGSHEHPDSPADHDHEVPAREDRNVPRRTSTVSVIPTLFQPVCASVPEVHLAAATSLVSTRKPLLMEQTVIRLASPRAPPSIL